MTPETKARQQIDQKLEQAGWVIQDMKLLNLAAGMGVAVREYPTDSGPADYVLFVNRHAVGVIEAKKDSAGENLTVTEAQTERYAKSNLFDVVQLLASLATRDVSEAVKDMRGDLSIPLSQLLLNSHSPVVLSALVDKDWHPIDGCILFTCWPTRPSARRAA